MSPQFKGTVKKMNAHFSQSLSYFGFFAVFYFLPTSQLVSSVSSADR